MSELSKTTDEEMADQALRELAMMWGDPAKFYTPRAISHFEKYLSQARRLGRIEGRSWVAEIEELRTGIDALLAELDSKVRDPGSYSSQAATDFARRWREGSARMGAETTKSSLLRSGDVARDATRKR